MGEVSRLKKYTRIIADRRQNLSEMSVPETNTPNPAAQYPDERSVPNAWLVRPCEAYNDEYKECTSIKGRFHQYFIEGNNVWKHRDSPPVDWNKPLPAKMQEEFRDTYL